MVRGRVTYLEEVEEIFCVGERPIIVRQRNVAISTAPIDAFTVGNVSNLGTSDVGSVWTIGTHICITGWTVLNLTRWSRAVEVSSSTPAAILVFLGVESSQTYPEFEQHSSSAQTVSKAVPHRPSD